MKGKRKNDEDILLFVCLPYAKLILVFYYTPTP